MEDGRQVIDALQALTASPPSAAGTHGVRLPVVWPDAILIDVNMPRLGGADTIREARRLAEAEASTGRPETAGRLRGLVWIGLTGSDDGGLELVREGARQLLGKPVIPDELWTALSEEAGLKSCLTARRRKLG